MRDLLSVSKHIPTPCNRCQRLLNESIKSCLFKLIDQHTAQDEKGISSCRGSYVYPDRVALSSMDPVIRKHQEDISLQKGNLSATMTLQID